ncbi:hypothetical protein FTO74_00095 [Granulicella sp. WH15]|uniref:hypothetical protein n=1 Tax=Granulicella sp. WH15 TaxID=2602070 RepID=UPI0013669550|nr:hypothetical protein [Granulicella sp. WH15]QHN01955.1 hypothetical protein FTO74_00095 [Granulicella sp. WH15]
MKLTIDNLDGKGAVDYSGAVDRSNVRSSPLKIQRVLNEPSILSGMLCLEGTALPGPVRRGRVVVAAQNGTVLFTGYLATEPESVYAGVGGAGPVYRLAFSAVSDEWLLDKQPAVPFAGAGLSVEGGTLLQTLVQRAGGGVTISVATTQAVGVFQPKVAAAWSVNTGEMAAAAYSSYRALNGVVSLEKIGTTTHSFSDGDGTLTVAALRTAAVRELANDVMLSGDIEPWAYVTELFQGDGTTTAFTLDQPPFVAKANQRKPIDDSFNTGVFNTDIWAVTDPGSHLGFSSAGLQMSGGNGLDGQTTLTAIDAVELGGALLLELGNVQLSAASDGVLGGFYAGVTSRTNCFAGFNVRQSGGQTLVVPMVGGVEVGTSFAVLGGHSYTLRIRLHSVEMQRVAQSYYATVDGVVTQFGGGLRAAPVTVVMDLIDLGAASNTPATVLYDGTTAGAVANAPATCSFVPVNSVQLIGSVGFVRLTQVGSTWVTSTPPGGATATRLMGTTGEGVDCKVAQDGSVSGKVTFFAGRVPVAGETIAVTYRGRNRALARIANAASVAAEAAGGAQGSARWLGHVVRPEARSSADCESAAMCVLSFATARAAAVSGSYAVARAADVWPGDVLALTTNGDSLSVIVRKVTVEDGGVVPESLSYSMDFANDWAEGLGIALSETLAADAVPPTTALSAPAQVLANLQSLAVVSATTTALQVDAGVAPPSGGGFEVRRRDDDFGPGVDQDLVLRSPVRSFSIPRVSEEERFFVRMYDGGSPPLYSRCSSEVVTHLPV